MEGLGRFWKPGLGLAAAAALMVALRAAVPLFGYEAANRPAILAIDAGLVFAVHTLTILIVLALFALAVVAARAGWRVASAAPPFAQSSLLARAVAAMIIFAAMNETALALVGIVYNGVATFFIAFVPETVAAFFSGLECVHGHANSANGLKECVVEAAFEGLGRVRDLFGQAVFGSFGADRAAYAISAFLLFFGGAILLDRAQRDLGPRQWFWAAYCGLAALAIYLALISILATPLLDEGTERNGQSDANTLQSDLTAMIPTELRNRTAINPVNQSDGRSIAAKDVAANGAPAATAAPAQVDPAAELDLRMAQTLESGVALAVRFYEQASRRRPGGRESEAHYRSLLEWQFERVEAVASARAECRAALLPSARTLISDAEARRRVEEELPFPGLASARFDPVRIACDPTRPYFSLPPTRPTYGAHLGPVISPIASWLVATESEQATLIVGLIGFGLLGALVSRFVAESPLNVGGTGGPPDVAVETAEIARIVFVGFSAAIIVFVASYGGLLLLSESGADPNPYVVYTGCLVGAAYGEVIWKEARDRLARRGKDADGADAKAGGGEPGSGGG